MEKQPYSASVKTIFSRLESSRDGLSQDQAQTRLEKYGFNELPPGKKKPRWLVFAAQFLSPLIYILLIAAVVSIFARHYIDAFVIFGILLLNAVIGFSQETRAESAMDALMRMASPRARAIRDGTPVEIAAREIVPGDIILLAQGDRVLADSRLIEAANLKVDESAFTGESVPAAKQPGVLPDSTPAAEAGNMVFSGTTITYGRARALVTGTGSNTEIGTIASSLQSVRTEKTPVQKSIARLSNYIILLMLGIITVLVTVSLMRGMQWLEVFLLAVAAAVSAIPEGLPAVVTVTLALGMRTMAQRNAVIRRLVAVETLGSATVICSDKTGTLTLNQMTVRQLQVNGQMVSVTGEGYQPSGHFEKDGERVDVSTDEAVLLHLKIGALCNDASLKQEAGAHSISGDPTEAALLVAAAKAGIDNQELNHTSPRKAEIPFESETQFMATLHQINGQDEVVYVKGSAEKLLSMSNSILLDGQERPLTEDQAVLIRQASEEMASQALRILATGFMHLTPGDKLEPGTLNGRLVFVGLSGMADPPREEAHQAVKACGQAGIRVVMITGDNEITAASIAEQIGLPSGNTVTGRELNSLSDAELASQIEYISVFARTEPLQKLRIVRAFKARGEVVAVTGDGVNDAPALKAANIGIAMGLTGTDVAREASDMVLADDNFTSVVAAVEEGRAIFARLRNVVFFLLSTNLGELLALIFSVALVGTAPLLAVQIIWVNLVTDASSSIPLSLESKTGDELKHPPRHPKTGLIYPGLLLRIAFLAAIMGVFLTAIFTWAESRMSLEEARTLAFTAMVSFEWFRAFNARSDEVTVWKLGLFKNRALLIGITLAVVLQVAVVYLPFMQTAFSTVALQSWQWGIALAAGASLFAIEELRKVFFPRLFSLGKWQPVNRKNSDLRIGHQV